MRHASRSEGISYGVPANYDRSRFLPFIGATYDINANVSAYASYATIFNPQTQIDANFRILDPIKGNNVEVGLKGAWYDGRLNASIAVTPWGIEAELTTFRVLLDNSTACLAA